MSDHEHDEYGNCMTPGEAGPQGYSNPTWRWSFWEVAAVTVAVAGGVSAHIGGMFNVVHQGAQMLNLEFRAAANYSRQNYELRIAQEEYDAQQAQAAEELRLMVEGPDE